MWPLMGVILTSHVLSELGDFVDERMNFVHSYYTGGSRPFAKLKYMHSVQQTIKILCKNNCWEITFIFR